MTNMEPTGSMADGVIRLDLKPFGPGGEVDELLLHVRTSRYAGELRAIALQEGAYKSDVGHFSTGWEPILSLVCSPAGVAAITVTLTSFFRRHRGKRIVFDGVELHGYSVKDAERLIGARTVEAAHEQAAIAKQTALLIKRDHLRGGATDSIETATSPESGLAPPSINTE